MHKSDMETNGDPRDFASVWDRARAHAPFLARLGERNPDMLERARAGEWVPEWTAAGDTPDRVAETLRRDKQRLALGVALGDLAGALPFERVVHALSDFADHAAGAAIAAAMHEVTGADGVEGMSVLALGKHGSRELNYSSDIDLVLLLDPDRLASPKGDPRDTAVRIGRKFVGLLQDRTQDGYVFRVDLRLRPSPEVTPIALPVNAAISHYETIAEAWERAAFIRARHVGGDASISAYFLDALRPFVWRSALDFGTISEIRGISKRIRDHHSRGQTFGPGFDLKRGRGGIREIEFFAQIHQLIHGGRDPSLREPATLDALAALADVGWIGNGEAETLSAHYRLFRTIEHRLQMVEDQQTHRLPTDGAALDNVARLHGLADGDTLIALLADKVAWVGDTYDRFDETDEPQDAMPRDPAELEKWLSDKGFSDAEGAVRRIERWRTGNVGATRSKASREALEAILPQLISDLGASPAPITALNRLDSLLDRLPSALNLFRLLEARPGLGALLTDILARAPALADELARRAELFDGLIDATALDPPEPVGELVEIFRERTAGLDYQEVLDRMRQLVGEERFALGVQLVEAASDPLDVAAGYARVAEASIELLAGDTVDAFREEHGEVPGSEFVILALGRLGGGALTHASDLDLVYLFTGDHGAESDGERPLGATRYYQRLAQRVTAALSVPTAAGPLYEVDTRLRPSGGQGLIAVSLDSFEGYQRQSAWTWEHMALARARPVYGSPEAREKLSGIIRETLIRPRDPEKLLADARNMRAEITAAKPAAGALDVKLVPGGLVDLEFCTHVAQLREGKGLSPYLPEAIAALIEAGVLDPDMAAAHDLLTRMLVTLRLVSPDSTEVSPASRSLVAKACHAEDWDALVEAYDKARHCVREQFEAIGLASDEEGQTR